MRWMFCALSVVMCFGCDASKREESTPGLDALANAHEVELRFDAEDAFPAHAITVQWLGPVMPSEVVPRASGSLHEMTTQCVTPQRWASRGGLILQVDLTGTRVETTAPLAPEEQRCLDDKAGILAQALQGFQIQRARVRIAKREIGERRPQRSPTAP